MQTLAAMTRNTGASCVVLLILLAGCARAPDTHPKMTIPQFVTFVEEVPLGTSRENVVAFFDKRKAFLDENEVHVLGRRTRFPDEFVRVILVKHERAKFWSPSIEADYKFKRGKLVGFQYRELHLP